MYIQHGETMPKKKQDSMNVFGSIDTYNNIGKAFDSIGQSQDASKKKENQQSQNANQFQKVSPNMVAGFLDNNGVFHPLPNSNQMPREEPLTVEDKLDCPCLNCKIFGSHNPTQEERKKVMITIAQLVACGIFILGIVIIILKVYVFN
jgi:hypothetical protein